MYRFCSIIYRKNMLSKGRYNRSIKINWIRNEGFFINRIFFSHQIDRISSWTFLNSLFIYSTLIQGTILFFTEFFRPENVMNYFIVDKKNKKKIMESHGIIITYYYLWRDRYCVHFKMEFQRNAPSKCLFDMQQIVEYWFWT